MSNATRAAFALVVAALLAAAGGCSAPRSGPPLIRDVRIRGAYFDNEGLYRLPEEHGEVVLEATVEGARQVTISVAEPDEPETPLFSAAALLHGGRSTVVRRWNPPDHAFYATVLVTAENREGKAVVEPAPLLHHQPPGAFEPAHPYGGAPPPWAPWEPLRGLPQQFHASGWLDSERIWGQAEGRLATYDLRTQNCSTVWLGGSGAWLHPDGHRLFFADGEGLKVMDIHGGGKTLLVPARLLGNEPEGLIWSPDGREAIILVQDGPSPGGWRSYHCALDTGALQALDIDGTPVAWVSGRTLLLQRLAYSTRDGRPNSSPSTPVGAGLATWPLSCGQAAEPSDLVAGSDCVWCEFRWWQDAAHRRFVFLMQEPTVLAGPGDTVTLTDSRTLYATWDLDRGLLETWEPPSRVSLLAGAGTPAEARDGSTAGAQRGPDQPVQRPVQWAQRAAACPAELGSHPTSDYEMDLGLVRSGAFRPRYRLEYFEGLWGPYFNAAGDGVLTCRYWDPGTRTPACRTYLIAPRQDSRKCGPR